MVHDGYYDSVIIIGIHERFAKICKIFMTDSHEVFQRFMIGLPELCEKFERDSRKVPERSARDSHGFTCRQH